MGRLVLLKPTGETNGFVSVFMYHDKATERSATVKCYSTESLECSGTERAFCSSQTARCFSRLILHVRERRSAVSSPRLRAGFCRRTQGTVTLILRVPVAISAASFARNAARPPPPHGVPSGVCNPCSARAPRGWSLPPRKPSTPLSLTFGNYSRIRASSPVRE
ncbi:hypothetical protein SKAU_G00187950 [Synaphobranchus kaupii]|uniref:Uncharacterized protein n=1 Tax=Synaphobranchus kaupii TaxID=118154 RepID=A0A9Q1FD46_SYNKA|nr:hypothetical protein SKAU_G00187950 [Synaphobranchus kaupii]